MFTRRFVLLGLAGAGILACIAVPSVGAQERPDLSGSWTVEQVEMQRPQDGAARDQAGRRGGGGSGGGGFGRRGGGQGGGQADGRQSRGGAFSAMFEKGDRVSIRQTADALIVSDESRQRVSNYPFDGRETSNRGAGDNTTVKTKTRWEGVALVTESTQTLSGRQGERTITTREVRSLSADGRTMTLVVTPENVPGANTTVTFTRADDAR